MLGRESTAVSKILFRPSDRRGERSRIVAEATGALTTKTSTLADRVEMYPLRFVAVVAVIAFHVWPSAAPGGFVGVDMFFVLSGTLITLQLIKGAEVGGSRLKFLRGFWLRRVARLLPAALAVVVVVMVTVWTIVPKLFWDSYLSQTVGAVAYVQNWVLISEESDYLNQDSAPTALRHFWSLAVEEQFYLVWPLVVVAVWVVAHALRFRPGRLFLGVVALVTLVSLAASILQTESDPPAAYFSTVTRAWELTTGAVVALILHRGFVVRPLVGRCLAFIGWFLVVYSIFALDTADPFPGALALIPVIGTSLVILGGSSGALFDRVYGNRAVRWGSEHSYALYLWHWPAIVLLPIALDAEFDGPIILLVLTVTVAASVVSRRYIETLFWAPHRPLTKVPLMLVSCFALSAAIVISVFVTQASLDRDRQASTVALASAEEVDNCFGALAAGNDACADSHTLREGMSPEAAASDIYAPANPAFQDAHCDQELDAAICTFGNPDADYSVVLAGDSHAAQWSDALILLSEREDWKLTVYYYGGCPVLDRSEFDDLPIEDSARDDFTPVLSECSEWSSSIIEGIASDPSIDAVVTSGYMQFYSDVLGADPEISAAFADGLARAYMTWLDAGKTVLAIRDTPSFGGGPVGDVPACISTAATFVDPCTFEDGGVFPDSITPRAAEGISDPEFRYWDPSELFCDDELCHTVVGGLIAFSDADHLTATFSRSAASNLLAGLTDQ